MMFLSLCFSSPTWCWRILRRIYRPLRSCKSTKLHNCFLQPLAYNEVAGRYDVSGHEVSGATVARDGYMARDEAALRDDPAEELNAALGTILDERAEGVRRD